MTLCIMSHFAERTRAAPDFWPVNIGGHLFEARASFETFCRENETGSMNLKLELNPCEIEEAIKAYALRVTGKGADIVEIQFVAHASMKGETEHRITGALVTFKTEPVKPEHLRACGVNYRGCAPDCPFDLAQRED